MQPTPKMPRDESINRMRTEVDEVLGQVADAIDGAPPGQIIAGREGPGRDPVAGLRQQASEAGSRRRVDAAGAALPPPKDPSTGKEGRDEGRQGFTALTTNGRVRRRRRRRDPAGQGTTTPRDRGLDPVGGTIGPGVREMARRLNGAGKDSDKAAADSARTARVRPRGETSRVPVEAEGKRAVRAQRSGQPPADRSAAGCRTGTGTTRVDVGGAGVVAPRVTGAERAARRQGVEQGRRRGQEARPSPPLPGGRSGLQGVRDRRLPRRRAGASPGVGHAGRPRGGRAADAAGSRPHRSGPGR